MHAFGIIHELMVKHNLTMIDFQFLNDWIPISVIWSASITSLQRAPVVMSNIPPVNNQNWYPVNIGINSSFIRGYHQQLTGSILLSVIFKGLNYINNSRVPACHVIMQTKAPFLPLLRARFQMETLMRIIIAIK